MLPAQAPKIDLQQLIRDKNPVVAKLLPKFILNYLKRVIHQEDINTFLAEHHEKQGAEFCTAVIEDFDIDLDVSGLEHVPKNGKAIFVVNHPLGGMDAMAIVHTLKHVRPDIKFIVNDILMSLENLKTLFVGVNKVGVSSKQALQKVNELFASDQAVFLFPAGLVSRRKKGLVRDLEWKKAFVKQAKRNKTDVIPVFIDGELSNWFYNLSNFRSALGITANLEMLYLADELYQQKGRKIPLIFGEPISYTTFDKSKTDAEWAEWTKEQVYAMKQKV